MDWLDYMMANDFVGSQIGPETALLVMLVAFCIGHLIAWTYMWTHTGLSYSQLFTSSLLVQPVIVAIVMLLMAGNILVAIGVLSIFAMIRFRNVLKDTRDTTYILWGIVEGVAVGNQRFGIAVLGAIVISLIFIYLRVTSFGGRHRYDVILSLEWAGTDNYASTLKPLLRRHSMRSQLASQHDLDANKLDLSFRLLLRDPSRSRELLSELEKTEGVARASLFHRSDEAEV
ncbi:MAG TPA: DUF4956 domain-containing protein [Tepidisphaeraceae bacterium]|jgi:hypothetical protein|nr:DUF4956 domain-containing protein [Tepidisphaeraceae bacterium]